MISERVQPLRERVIAWGWRGLVGRTVSFALAWWTLNEGDLAGAGFGVVIVVLALAVSLALPSTGSGTWQLAGLVRFALVFVSGSIRGGIDVARRAFAPDLPLAPAMVRYAVRVRAGPPRNLFTCAISLMPGTLSVALEPDLLEIHVLVGDQDVLRELERLERAVAGAAGQRLEAARA